MTWRPGVLETWDGARERGTAATVDGVVNIPCVARWATRSTPHVGMSVTVRIEDGQVREVRGEDVGTAPVTAPTRRTREPEVVL